MYFPIFLQPCLVQQIEAAGARAQSSESAEPSKPVSTQPTWEGRNEPSSVSRRDKATVVAEAPETAMSPGGLQSENGAKGSRQEMATSVKFDKKLERKEDRQARMEKASELARPDVEAPSSSAPPAAAIIQPPSGARALFADDWEADIFGSEDAKTTEGLGLKTGAPNMGASQVKLGPVALSSDFAKMAVAGSADASEFSLGDDDDFNSDDGF
jgi:hypothetical protein